MELLPITLAANETRQFAKAGRYFEIIDSTYSLTIQFTGTNGSISDSIVGALSGLFIEDPFTHFSLTNGATAQTVTLLIMETGRGGSRRQPGNVRVIDASVDKTTAGNQFFQSLGIAAFAGQGSIVVLSPNGGAKRLIVKAMAVQSAVAGLVLFGSGSGGGTAAAYAVGALNTKLIGGALSQSRQGGGAIAGTIPTGGEITGVQTIAGLYIPANVVTTIPLTTPFVVSGSQTLWVSGNALNRDIAAVFDVEEL